MIGVGWLVDLWQRMTHPYSDAAPRPPAAHLVRDPDLDAMHKTQHELLNQTGYAAEATRRSMEERAARQRILGKAGNPRGIGRNE